MTYDMRVVYFHVRIRDLLSINRDSLKREYRRTLDKTVIDSNLSKIRADYGDNDLVYLHPRFTWKAV